MNGYVVATLFAVVAFVQVFVAGSIIWEKEKILKHGKVFKFRTATFDPSDPFRGKFITLSFEAGRWKEKVSRQWNFSQYCYVIPGENDSGYAKVKTVLPEAPTGETYYVKCKVAAMDFAGAGDSSIAELFIEYPFERFYMPENKAPLAEEKLFEIARDTTQIAYALVSIWKGKAVIQDVFIGNTSVNELVKNNKE